jgi:hypothetical protein
MTQIYFSATSFKAFVLVLLIATLASCEKEEISLQPPNGDYYPIKIGNTWEYQYTHTSRWDTGVYVSKQEALKDTVHEGKRYVYFGLQLIRKENGNYYRRTNFYGIGEEYIFLKDNLPVGGTWTHSSHPNHKAEFTIVAIHPEITMNGKKYKHVIEVRKQDFHLYDTQTEFTLTQTITTYYARNIGEIYSMEDQVNEYNTDYEYKLISYQLK